MKRIKDNIFFIFFLITGFMYQLKYVYTVCANVPLMDYWKYINMFAEKLFSGNLVWADIWQNDGIHRSPVQFIYFLLNMKLFHMDSRIEIYLGCVLMAGTIVFLYCNLKKSTNISQKKIFTSFIGMALVIIIYNLNQYEILSEQFSLSFATRMFIFIFSFALISKFVIDVDKYNYKSYILLGLFLILVLTCFSGGYFPAYVASISFVLVLDFCVIKDHKKYLGKYFVLFLSLIIGSIIYMYDIIGMTEIAGNINIGLLDFVIGFITGMLTMLGVSVIGFEFSNRVTLCIGLCIFIMYLASFVLYFKKKFYQKTYIPVLLYGYSMGAMGLIYLGRLDMYGSSFAYASRYVCETNLAILGFLWIMALYYAELTNYQGISYSIIKKGIAYTSVVFLLIGIVNSNIKEWAIAPYRKIYQENLIQAMCEVDSLSSDDFSSFQADEKVVRNGIELMKKYELGIYNNFE